MTRKGITLPSGWEIRHTVSDENDHWGLVVRVAVRSLRPRLLDRSGFVVAQISVILPDNFPLTPVLRDQSVVGDNVDMFGLVAQEFIKDPAEDGFKTGGDHVERNLPLDAEIMEFPEIGIHLEALLHHFEPVLKGDIETTPHLLGSIPE
jgi:hypothetical protein